MDEPDGPDDGRGPKTTDTPIAIDDRQHFETVLDANHVVLVDFYADWCGPCKTVAPIVEEIAAETQAVVTKIDTEANPKLAQECQVRGIPTLYLFVDAEPTERMVGVQTKETLVDVITSNA